MSDKFAAKNRELRDRRAELPLEIEVCDQGRNETIDIAVKAFELSQRLRAKCLTADYAGASLVTTMRKAFGRLAKGLV